MKNSKVIAFTIAILVTSCFSAYAADDQGITFRVKGGLTRFTGTDSIPALNPDNYILLRRDITANGFTIGLDVLKSFGVWDIGVSAGRLIRTATSYSYLLGGTTTYRIRADKVSTYFGAVAGGIFVTQQDFISSFSVSSLTVNRFALGPVGGIDVDLTDRFTVGAQLQYWLALGPDSNFGAVATFLAVGFRI
jgi:hypothetical protein